MKHDVSQFTPSQVEALPAPLPAGERLIWQGKPSFKGLALRAFHIREVAIYFAALLVWRLWSNAAAGMPAGDAMVSAAWLVVPALAGIAVLAMLAWLFARAACYTLTSKRVLIQFGVALPMTMNIPLDTISGAALKMHRDGTGDIPLKLTEDRGSFVLLWPHVRPWKLRAAEPMLRAVPDAAIVAAKLNEALSSQHGSLALAVNQTATARHATIPANAIAAA